jgi:hypothetical protein
MTSKEAGHSIDLQVQRPKVITFVILLITSIVAWVAGCKFSDLDLHVRDGALTYGPSESPKVVVPLDAVNQPPRP